MDTDLLKEQGNVSSKISPKIDYKVRETFFAILRFIHMNDWQGACHASSALLYILLREQKYNADLFIGEAGVNSVAFDHSWIEIDGKVYDAAISNTLIKEIRIAPVMANIDLSTGNKCEITYGINSSQGYDSHAQAISKVPFSYYMDNFPEHPKGLWGLAKDMGKGIGVSINLGKVKTKYGNTIWQEKI